MDKDKYIGKKIDGRYEIQELVGVGGMAYVYKGFDVLENRVVAIKILKEEFSDNEEFRRRFKNESKAIAALDHPNIVKVYDFCFNSSNQSIIMEYIDGITLKEYIDRQGVLTWKEAVHFTEQILQALEHAHQRGIVHRDIKPQNIMLLADGSLKIMDFGIARFARNEMHTMTDKAIGSVHYISPEQARGDRADQKSDLYSVGVILFEMLTGKLPFDADSAVSVAIKQISSKAVNPRELNPDIPEGLEEITVKAMRKDPATRYQSAAEMLADIDEFKKNPSIQFEYKYYVDENPTKYIDSINEVREETKNGKKNKKVKFPPIPILAGIAAGFFTVSICFMLWVFAGGGFGSSQTMVMDDLTGHTIEWVTSQDKYKNITISVEGEEFSEEYPAGTIIDQDPAVGRSIKDNTIIKVVLSKGGKELKVPDIVKMQWTTAEKLLTSMGINYTVEEIYDDSVSAGYVIKTDPERENSLTSSDTVTVYVSKGKAQSAKNPPNLLGMSEEAAKRLIEQEGFKVGTIKREDNKAPTGTVISQVQSSSSELGEGSAIDFTVSTGEYETSVSVSVKLPQSVTRVVTMSYKIGDTSEEIQLQPSVRKTWNFSVTGKGTQTLEVYFDGKLYQSYTVDFGEGKASMNIDNSSQFEESSSDDE